MQQQTVLQRQQVQPQIFVQTFCTQQLCPTWVSSLLVLLPLRPYM